MDQWPLDDGLAQADEDEEHDKVERADDGKGSRQASYGVGERIGRRKGEVDDGDDQQYSGRICLFNFDCKSFSILSITTLEFS